MITLALLVTLLLAVLILPGCVAQEYEYCPPRLFITTDQDAGWYSDPPSRALNRARYVDEWFESIDSIHVYIFDENERFVAIWAGGPYTPGKTYEVPFDKLGLPEGVFSFVAWSNRWGDHTCNVQELLASGEDFYLDDMRLNLDTREGVITSDVNHRHWGILERANMTNMSVISPLEYTIVIDPSIHRANFMLEGVEVDGGPTRAEAEDYSVTVSDNNSIHTFRNDFVPGQPTYYNTRAMMDVTGAPGGPGAWFDDETGIPPAGADYKEGVSLLTASMNVVHLHDLSKTGFVMRNDDTGEVIFEEDDIVGLINLVYSANNVAKVNFEETLEFDILVSFIAPYYVNININGWTYRLNEIDL